MMSIRFKLGPIQLTLGEGAFIGVYSLRSNPFYQIP